MSLLIHNREGTRVATAEEEAALDAEYRADCEYRERWTPEGRDPADVAYEDEQEYLNALTEAHLQEEAEREEAERDFDADLRAGFDGEGKPLPGGAALLARARLRKDGFMA